MRMFPSVWSSLFTVKMAALGTFVSLAWVILRRHKCRAQRLETNTGLLFLSVEK